MIDCNNMECVFVDKKQVHVFHDGCVTDSEISEAAHRAASRCCDKVRVSVDGEELVLEYHYKPVPFERIRRITGYLVGTMDRWNDGKCAEESDRVKHSMSNRST